MVSYDPLFISIKTASASLAITFCAGLAAARLVTGIKNRPLKMLLDGFFTLPLVLPPTAAGFFLLAFFGARGPAGAILWNLFGVRAVFTWGATVLASAVVSFPLMYRGSRGALEQIDGDLVLLSRTLGLGEWDIFWRVSLPLALPGVAAGTILAFVRGLGEFGATAMAAGNIAGRTRTLPLAIYSEAAAGNMNAAGAYAALLLAVSVAAVFAMNAFMHYNYDRRQ